MHPVGRRGPSSLPLKVRARNPFRSKCDKRADNFHMPQPEGPENHDSDTAAPSENFHLVDEMLRKIQAAGVRETPNMYIMEKEQISNYEKKLYSSRGTMDVEEYVMASIVCTRAQEALDLASLVMDIASLRRGTIPFSQHTVNQMVRTYAALFCNVAEDAYHMKFKMETFLSFLAALRGLGSIYHILVQDTVAKLKDRHFKNSITNHMGKHSKEFDKVVKYMEDIAVKIKPKEMTRLLMDGLICADVYIASLRNCRESALNYLED